MNYIFGYGSLLSRYSRQHYSNIYSPVEAATLNGWKRAWCAAYPDERATYAGALPSKSRQLDGLLIPSEIDEGIVERERGYQFTRLSLSELVIVHSNIGSNSRSGFRLSDDDQVWICESLMPELATLDKPLPQSYVDTCISGCMESHGVEGAKRFIQQTNGWDCIWVNDRHLHTEPIYPRYTAISIEQSKLIDSLLEYHGVLKFRLPVSPMCL